MGIQMTIPFTVLQNGAVSVETDQNTQTAQRVNAIVSTEVGQRAMRAAMGLPLSRLLFDANDNFIASEMASLVTQQLSTYEPGIQVLSVTPDTSQSNNGLAAVNVNYAPVLQASTTSAVSNVVTIQVGGTVTEVTVNGNS
jgi:phage baseplate assembly protein W